MNVFGFYLGWSTCRSRGLPVEAARYVFCVFFFFSLLVRSRSRGFLGVEYRWAVLGSGMEGEDVDACVCGVAWKVC